MKLPGQCRLSRFLTQSNHYKSGSATYKAFLPPPDLQFSTYHTDDLTDNEIRDVAATHVLSEMILGRSIYGRADLSVADYNRRRLTVDRDDNPDRHTAVTGWPVGTADDKEAHKEIAIDLAASALLVLFASVLTRE